MASDQYRGAMVWYHAKKFIRGLLRPILPRALWNLVVKLQQPTRSVNALVEQRLLSQWQAARSSHRASNAPADPPGVNVVGYVTSMTGLGEAARSSMQALQAARIPFSINRFTFRLSPNQETALPVDQSISDSFEYRVNLLHVNPPEVPYLWDELGPAHLAGKYSIGVWYWEMPEIPDEWLDRFHVLDELWVATQFVKNAVAAKSPIPVVQMPPAISFQCDTMFNRASFGLPEDRYLFLCSFDVHSVQDRKNPAGAIAAFKQAFGPDDTSVGLVVKISNADDNRAGVKQLEAEMRAYANCFFIEEAFRREQFNGLLNVVDAYVSLHRSEGFGLVPAEAMYLGKPAVVTNWSGNVDFANQDNACPVNYRLVRVGPGRPPYDPDQYWAEPDVDQAAAYLRRLCRDAEYRERISAAARRTMRADYSPEAIGRRMRERLTEIGCL